jgi:hypothetical protein
MTDFILQESSIVQVNPGKKKDPFRMTYWKFVFVCRPVLQSELIKLIIFD